MRINFYEKNRFRKKIITKRLNARMNDDRARTLDDQIMQLCKSYGATVS